MFSGYGLGGFTKDIKLNPEEVEKLKSKLIEWDGEFYPKIFRWKNPEDLYRACIKQSVEIKRLNNIINELEKYNNERLLEWENCQDRAVINSSHYIKLIKDIKYILKGVDKE